MKISEVMIDAAKIMQTMRADGKWLACCEQICDAQGVPYTHCNPGAEWFAELFEPDNSCSAYWGAQWADYDDPNSYNKRADCRILALCLAAAIAESEGL